MAEDLFELIRTQGVERIGRYYSKYRALVLDSKPDDNDMGSIMVHIPRVQGGMKIVARSKATIGNPGYGMKYFTPRPGEIVWIEFENGNPTRPLWSYHTWAKEECPDDLNDINTCGIVTPHGHKLLIKESDQGDSISIQMYKGLGIKISDKELSIQIGDTNIQLDSSKVNINSKTYQIDASDNINLKGDINLNEGNNGGLVNIELLKSFIQATMEDLITAKSGTKVSSWISSNLSKLEDTKVRH